jgi:hypothetical protein
MSTESRRQRSIYFWPGLAAAVYSVLALVAAYLAQRLHIAISWCPFKNLTGMPCPFCGGTRAALALLQGNIKAAFVFNPLAAVICLLAPVAAICWWFYWRPRHQELELARWLWYPVGAIIAVNWAYLIWVGR